MCKNIVKLCDYELIGVPDKWKLLELCELALACDDDNIQYLPDDIKKQLQIN